MLAGPSVVVAPLLDHVKVPPLLSVDTTTDADLYVFLSAEGTLHFLMVMLLLKLPETFIQVRLEDANAGDDVPTKASEAGTESETAAATARSTRRIRKPPLLRRARGASGTSRRLARRQPCRSGSSRQARCTVGSHDQQGIHQLISQHQRWSGVAGSVVPGRSRRRAMPTRRGCPATALGALSDDMRLQTDNYYRPARRDLERKWTNSDGTPGHGAHSCEMVSIHSWRGYSFSGSRRKGSSHDWGRRTRRQHRGICSWGRARLGSHGALSARL